MHEFSEDPFEVGLRVHLVEGAEAGVRMLPGRRQGVTGVASGSPFVDRLRCESRVFFMRNFRSNSANDLSLGFVIPVYNEEETLKELHERICLAVEPQCFQRN